MTLHEAIEMILQDTGKPMTAIHIAELINDKKLYSRRDGKPVSASQINSRVGNHVKIFIKESGKIKLLKDDKVSLALQKYKNEISNLLKSSNYSLGGKIKVLTDVLEDLKPEPEPESESDNDIDNFEVSEPIASYGRDKNKDKLKIAFRLCNWYLQQDSNFRMVFNEQFVSVLSGMYWFKNGHHNLSTDIQDSNHFILKIVSDNPKATFQVNNKQFENKKSQ
ncbi:winged helix-turn-helix domain-containing protein, partial [Winogradskyella sp.]|nr:winged helix-turn-helix domain-containing protein [Winogradskyella sp.]